ncbi:MAG TPA: ATP-binding cassette domain-containing protein [Steroidobacteraceae bacterium]|nr:ATP-binding cassette domain-containing protein [Steroidobacteraceae bacterium]
MLELRELRLRRGAAVLFDRANLTIFRGDKIGIVGRNGCGKSSLLALLRGDLGADAGDYSVPGKLNFVSVSQELPRTEATVLEYVRSGDTRLMAIEAELEKARAADDGMQEAHLLGDYDLAGGYTSAARAAELADGLGFEPSDIDRKVKELSGGLQMRANMARALMSRADVLMLDEPTNHLDLDAVLWLEGWLQRFAGTLLLVSHDREFLDDIVNRIVNLESGALTHWTGNYTDFQRQHAASIQQSAAMAARQARETARLHSFIDRFRAQASKARQVQSRIKALSKLETIATYQELDTFEWEFAAANKLPQPLVTLDGASAGYGDRVVISGVGRSVNPGERIGILGRNGAGKSTLMKLISGALPPSGGERVASPDLIVGNFAQLEVDRLDSRDTALIALTNRIDEIGARSQWDEQRRRNHLGGFGFRGDRVFEPVVHFSGGERARLALAILVAERPNLLLLDEPTNHLDFEMRHSLITALQDFAGAVIVVSHDRGLLRSVCDQFWLVAEGAVTDFEGDLEDYSNWLEKRGSSASTPAAPKARADSRGDKGRGQKREKAAARNDVAPKRQEIKSIETSLDKLGQERAKLEKELAGVDYSRDPAHARKVTERHAALIREVEQMETRWLELSERLESLNG